MSSISTTRTLETDIIEFAASLPYWAQYLSEKLLSGSALTDEDYEQSYNYVLEDAGLIRKSDRPKIDIVCEGKTGGYLENLRLKEISGVQGINALTEGQLMEFCPNLTIIYGANGSGKSGYIRLLNNVFISKGEKKIVANVFDTGTPKDKEAVFSFESDGKSYALKYPDDCARSEFRQFSVFDEKAVHAHLNLKNQFEFRPAGLAFFALLTDAYKIIEEKLQADITKYNQSANYTALFDGDSEIKVLLDSLTAKTKVEHLKKYLPFTEEDKAKRIGLEEQKVQLQALKKEQEIKDLSEKKSLLEKLKKELEDLNRYFSTAQLTKANSAIENCTEKEKLAKEHSIDSFKTDTIIGVGGEEWRNFVVAAGIFAREQDKDGYNYPQLGDVCLMCRQPLSESAEYLINSYWTFIESKAEQESKEAQAFIDKAKSAYESLNHELLATDSLLYKWMNTNYLTELQEIKNELTLQKQLKNDLIADLTEKRLLLREEVQISTTPLSDLVNIIDTNIKKLESSENEKALEELNNQLALINHREKLADHIDSIETTIKNLNWSATASKYKVQRRKITDKEKELSNLYFNQAYIEQFNLECEKLNGKFGVNVNHTGAGGVSYRQLTLQGKQPSEILSEGEQKVISLADFLSENQLSSVNKGIIFDDPVTSLDNIRKRKIADRLVDASEKKQVIIFSHDLVFVSLLITRCEDLGYTHECHWIEQRNGKPGHIYSRNAPIYEKKYRNQTIPQEYYLKSKKPDCPPQERDYLVQQGFTSLRTCYEVLVINDLFQNVVQRYNERVSVHTLEKVNFNVTARDAITEGFAHCCKHMEGHSHSDKYAFEKPEPHHLDTEIKRYLDIKAQVKAVHKELTAV